MVQAIDNPLISVALPIRNGMPHLRRAMQGLLDQTYKNFEVVIQDCLSTDGALDYLRSLGAPFPINIVSEQDDSLADAYSRAYARCRGDLVITAACDEYFDPDAFAKYVVWHQANPDAVFLYGGSRLVDAEGATQSVFTSGEFDLMDFVRFQMCPTQAGVYNRTILKDDLYFDRDMPWCPDYDLIIRMALKFGPNRLRWIDDVTMSARSDESSMSFRPELYSRFADYQMIAIERMVSGRYAEAFNDFLRRDLSLRLYLNKAKIAHSVTGDTSEFRKLAMAANHAMPGHPSLRQLATMSSGLVWAGPAVGLEQQDRIDRAPPEAATVFEAAADAVRCVEYWRQTGAQAEPVEGGTRVVTPASAAFAAASIPIDLSTVDPTTQHVWVQVLVRDVRGAVSASLYDAGLNLVSLEAPIPEAQGPQVFEIWMPGLTGREVLLRTGAAGGPATLIVEGVRVKVLDKALAEPETGA